MVFFFSCFHHANESDERGSIGIKGGRGGRNLNLYEKNMKSERKRWQATSQP